MGKRKLKKWPGKKVHRGDWVRNVGSWTGKVDDKPTVAADAIKEFLDVKEE